MSVKPSRLWLAIRLSDLPLDALSLNDSVSSPIVVIEKKAVVFANSQAAHAGACVGMDSTTAQLLSDCITAERDPAKEQFVLSTLCEQLYQFTPHIERYSSTRSAEAGLLLEIGTCLALFSGATALSQKIAHFLNHIGFQFSFGLAHSAKAAWFLSFADYEITGDESRPLFIERLNSLPITLLHDYPKVMDSLAKTGFRYFGDLAKQIQGKSLSSFQKRFGRPFTDLLCEVYDIDQHFMQGALFTAPRPLYKPEEWFEKDIQFEYPVTVVDQLEPAIESLLQQLSDYLRKRQKQCQSIEWTISDIYQRKETVSVHSDTPQSQWSLLYDLTLIQFENKALPFEVDTIRLACKQTLGMQPRSQVLDFDQNRRRNATVQDFATTIAKLKARLGDDAVYKLSYRDNLVPELTNAIISLAEKSNQTLPRIYQKSVYPTWLFSEPEAVEQRNGRLFWRGYIFPKVGPERIVGNWLTGPIARDYYLAQRHDNLRVWIFFDLYEKRWYVHGVFS